MERVRSCGKHFDTEYFKFSFFELSEALCYLEKCWVAECKESKICNRQFQNAEWPPSWFSTWNYPILRIYYLSQGNLALEFAYFCPFLYHGPKVRMFFFQKEGRFQSLNISPLKVLPASLNTDANFLDEERASLTNNTPKESDQQTSGYVLQTKVIKSDFCDIFRVQVDNCN